MMNLAGRYLSDFVCVSSGSSVHEKQLLDYADTCVKPAYYYFKLTFEQDLKPAMNTFKAAHFFFSVQDEFHAGCSK